MGGSQIQGQAWELESGHEARVGPAGRLCRDRMPLAYPPSPGFLRSQE